MRCQYESYHDDMYPEFAPEPIVIKCGERATHHWRYAEDAADEEGWPKRGVREVMHIWACTAHAAEYQEEHDPFGWGPFNPVLLSLEVSA